MGLREVIRNLFTNAKDTKSTTDKLIELPYKLEPMNNLNSIPTEAIISGYKVVELNNKVYTYVYPAKRHKKKRIQKKWLDNYGWASREIPVPGVVVCEDKKCISGHPKSIDKYLRENQIEVLERTKG